MKCDFILSKCCHHIVLSMVMWSVLVPDVFRPLHFGVEVQTEGFHLLTPSVAAVKYR